jgi:hypothetical protein
MWVSGVVVLSRELAPSHVFANLQHCVSEEDDKLKKLQESELPF